MSDTKLKITQVRSLIGRPASTMTMIPDAAISSAVPRSGWRAISTGWSLRPRADGYCCRFITARGMMASSSPAMSVSLGNRSSEAAFSTASRWLSAAWSTMARPR